jgi:Tol biopolymer transport system component
MKLRQPILILAAAAMLFAQADVTLQRAIRAETLEGNLKGAIALYEKAIAEAKGDRATAAKALIRMAECQEKLGQAEARRSYERVVKEFSDQKDAVQVARAKLSGGASARTPRARLVLDDARDLAGTVTPDGRLMSFIDRMTRDVGIRDLATGEIRMATNRSAGGKDPKGVAESSAISPDGKQLAYVWDAWDEEAVKKEAYFQLRVVNADGTGERTFRTSPFYIDVSSWSPDGRWIAASVMSQGRGAGESSQLMLIAAGTGEERILRTSSRLPKWRIRFSPDGKWLAYSETESPLQPPVAFVLAADGSAATETELARDAQMIGWSPDGRHILFARERQGASSLFAVPFAEGRVTGPPQPLYSASIIGRPLGVTPNGTLLHRLDNRRIDVWIGKLDTRTGRLGAAAAQFPGDKVRSAMNDNTLKFSPDGRQLVWIEAPNRLVFRSVSGEQERNFAAQLKEIRRIEWSPDGKSVLASGTGTDGQRALYRVDLDTGQTAVVTTKLNSSWLTFAPARDGKTIYYRTDAGKLAALSLNSGAETVLHEKFEAVPNVVPSPNGKSLAIRSGGNLGVLDLASGKYTSLYERDFSKDHNVMWALAWSEDNERVMVIARDYRTAACQLWIYSVDGGEPVRQPLTGDMR